MNKSISIIVSLLVFFTLVDFASAQSSETLKIGGFYPEESLDNGIIFGLHLKRPVDERMDFGFSAEYFGVKSTDSTEIQKNDFTAGNEELEESYIMVPIFLTLDYRLIIDFPFTPFVGGGAGYILLWDKYDNYYHDSSIEEDYTDLYHGFGWEAYGGIMMNISTKSVLVGEAFYTSGKPSCKEKDDEDAIGRPTRTELDISGWGFRIGIRFKG